LKQRIELHIETSYSYKNAISKIPPKDLLKKKVKDKTKIIGIVDYCTCLSIPIIEKLKKELKTNDLKVIYGISLNIKYDDIYIPSIILAKNKEGIKSIYKIVTKLNEDECYFISFKYLEPYKDNLILGISGFSFNEDYTNIINYYNYIEISPNMKKEEILNIEKYCNEKNLLFIATANPKTLSELDNYETNEMLKTFKFLKNPKKAVIENSYKLAENIEDYNLDFTKTYMPKPLYKNSLKKEVYERANLIYIENIPKNVKDRINYELNLIEKYNLEGTISIIENIILQAKKLGEYATVGSYFSHSLVSYLLGLTEINPMDLENQTNFLNDFENYGFEFEIHASQKIHEKLIIFTKKLLNTNDIYMKSSFFSKEEIIKNIHYFPNAFYLIPKEANIENLTPINNGISFKALSIDFGPFLKRCFPTIYFKESFLEKRLNLLEQKTNFYREYIPLDDKKVLKNTYIKVKSNEINNFKSYIHYNLANNYAKKLRICLNENEKEPKHLYDLLELKTNKKQNQTLLTQNQINPNWQCKVLNHYYDAYYATYYEKDYYKIYLEQLITYFKKEEIFNNNQDQSQNDAVDEFILQLIKTMKEKNLNNIITQVKKQYKKAKK